MSLDTSVDHQESTVTVSDDSTSSNESEGAMSRNKFLAILLLLTLLAFVLRYAALITIPAGLYQDEAFNGLDALKVLDGDHTYSLRTTTVESPYTSTW